MNGHIEKDILRALCCHEPPDALRIKAVEHIAECELCAQSYADCCVSIPTPPSLSCDIKKRTRSVAPKKPESDYSRLFYNLRVACAACIALISIVLYPVAEKNGITPEAPDLSLADKILVSLVEYSEKIVSNLEVVKYD